MSAPFETEEEDEKVPFNAPTLFKCPHCRRKKEAYDTKAGVRLCYTCFQRPYPLPPGCYWRDDDVNSFDTVSFAVEAQEKATKRMLKTKKNMVKGLSRGALTGWKPEESDSEDDESEEESSSASSSSESESSDSDGSDSDDDDAKNVIKNKNVTTLADVLATKKSAPSLARGERKRKSDAEEEEDSDEDEADATADEGEEDEVQDKEKTKEKNKIRRGLYKNRRILCINHRTGASFTVSGTKNVREEIPSMTRNKMSNCLFDPFYRTREGWQLVDLSEGFSKRKFNDEMVDEVNFTNLASSTDFKMKTKGGPPPKKPVERPIPKHRRLPPVWCKRPGIPEQYFKNRKVATEELKLPKWAITNFLSNKQNTIPGGWTFTYVPTESHTIKANALRVETEKATAEHVAAMKAAAKATAGKVAAKASAKMMADTEATIAAAKKAERARNRGAVNSSDFPYVAYRLEDEAKVLAGDNKCVMCFESQSEAAETFGCVQPFISLILNDKRKAVKGHKFMLRKTLYEKRREAKAKRRKTSDKR